MKTNKSKQGKKNREAGARFERKVRADLEDKRWIVDRWCNNVSLNSYNVVDKGKKVDVMDGSFLVPAKSTRFRSNTHGFPDFISFRTSVNVRLDKYYYDVRGVECKSNGYLKPEEKEKCKWLIDNMIFSKILIASKGKKRGEIIYKEFEND